VTDDCDHDANASAADLLNDVSQSKGLLGTALMRLLECHQRMISYAPAQPNATAPS